MTISRYLLFVSGGSPSSARALAALNEVRTTALGDGSVVEVVDVAKDPARAEEWRVVATPLLVRVEPLPARRVVGDLSRPELVRQVMSDPSDKNRSND